MDPFQTVLEVLRLLVAGETPTARLECSPCEGQACLVCGGEGSVALSSLRGTSPFWADEADILAQGQAVIGLQDPLLRGVVVPILEASRIMADDERSLKRRCESARASLARCQAEDWKNVCLGWVEHLEKGN